MPKLVDLGPYLADESVALKYTRSAVGSYDPLTGRWAPGTKTTSSFQGVIQPAVGVGSRTQPHLSDLPEGIRREMRHLVWTETRLDLDDIIEWAGRFYRVLFVWDREHDGGYTRVGIGLLHIDSSTEPPLEDRHDQIDDPVGPWDVPPGDVDPPWEPPPDPEIPPTPYDPKPPQRKPQCAPGKATMLKINKGAR
jgi:hypothetical protein